MNTIQYVKSQAEINGLTAHLIRHKKHLCFELSRGDRKRLFVAGKTPSDRLNDLAVKTQIRHIAWSLQ